MLILINPHAAGGTAVRKWERVRRLLFERSNHATIELLGNGRSLNRIVQDGLERGDRDFLAAGGDGTVNLVLNELLSSTNIHQRSTIRFGALGLGSSNDFHKPFSASSMLDGIPAKFRFEDAQPRDVGFLRYKDGEEARVRYFIANASIGVTANANYFFNNPDVILKWLKRYNTQAAILYAALRTIIGHRNKPVSLFGSWGCESAQLTNLGIVKNPHFSGDLCYNSPIILDNGKLAVHLCYDMSRFGLLRLLWALGHEGFHKIQKKKSYETDWLSVTGQMPFQVEFDGEIISTNSIRFGVLQKHLQVCP